MKHTTPQPFRLKTLTGAALRASFGVFSHHPLVHGVTCVQEGQGRRCAVDSGSAAELSDGIVTACSAASASPGDRRPHRVPAAASTGVVAAGRRRPRRVPAAASTGIVAAAVRCLHQVSAAAALGAGSRHHIAKLRHRWNLRQRRDAVGDPEYCGLRPSLDRLEGFQRCHAHGCSEAVSELRLILSQQWWLPFLLALVHIDANARAAR